MIERALTDRRRQPDSSSPTRIPLTACVPKFWTIAKLAERPTLASGLTIVPISVSNGRSGGGGARASCFCGGATIGTATIGGRRDAENSGRSRVADRALQRNCPQRVAGFATSRRDRARATLPRDRRLGDADPFRGGRGRPLDLWRGTGGLVNWTCRRCRRQGAEARQEDPQQPHHSDDRHCPATPIVIRMRPLSGSPKTSGDWIESLSTNRYGIPASMS